MKGNIKLVEYLLKNEADVNIQDDDKQTPLFYAFPANIDFDINCQGAIYVDNIDL